MDLKLYLPQNAVGNIVWSKAVMRIQSYCLATYFIFHFMESVSEHVSKHQDASRMEILQFSTGKSMNSN